MLNEALKLPYLKSQVEGKDSFMVSISWPDIVERTRYKLFDTSGGFENANGIQRETAKQRIASAVKYLKNTENPMFPPIIVAVIGKHKLQVNDNHLTMPPDEMFDSIDGACRTSAIAEVLQEQGPRFVGATQFLQIVPCDNEREAQDLFDLLNHTASKVAASQHHQHLTKVFFDAVMRGEEVNKSRSKTRKPILQMVAQGLTVLPDSPWNGMINLMGVGGWGVQSNAVEFGGSLEFIYDFAIENSNRLGLQISTIKKSKVIDPEELFSLRDWLINTINNAWIAWKQIAPNLFTAEACKTHAVRCGSGLAYNILVPSLCNVLLRQQKDFSVANLQETIAISPYLRDEGFWERGGRGGIGGGAVKYHGMPRREELADLLWNSIRKPLPVKQFWEPQSRKKRKKTEHSAALATAD